jgi:hypothetical protein
MRIGELERRSGLSTSRIRFYEAKGPLNVVSRKANEYREYPAPKIDRKAGLGEKKRGSGIQPSKSAALAQSTGARRAAMSTETVTNSTGKIALVTGGSRGPGRSTVLALAVRGVDTMFQLHRIAAGNAGSVT